MVLMLICKSNDGWSSLMIASQNGHTETVSLLLQNGAHVNMQENDGWSSLMIASQNGHTETVSLLLQNGAHVNMQENDGRSSLMIASQNGHTETVSLLLQNGAHVNMQENDGWSSLMIASQNGHTETVSLLLQNGAHVNMQENDGRSSLMIASQNGHTETVSLLLQNGAHVNMQKNNGWSSLMIASQNGHTETVSLLLQNGAHVNMQENDGWSSLMIASQNGHTETVSLLLQNGAHVNMQANNGQSSLMLAIMKGHTETALHLIENDADASLVNGWGDSALTLAVEKDMMSVVQEIVGKIKILDGGILDHRNASGNSPLMIACSRGHTEIAEMLLRAGARVNISNLSDYSFLHLPPHQINFPTNDSQVDSIASAIDMVSSHDIEVPFRVEARENFPISSEYSSLLPTQQIEFPNDSVKMGSIKGSALDIAVIRGDKEMVSLLVKYEAKIHNIYYLFRNVILKQAQENIQNRVSVTTNFFRATLKQEQEMNTESLLTSSCSWEKYYNIFLQLFSHDSDLINRVQRTNPSTLYMACAFGVQKMVQLLLELGMDVCDLYRTDDSGLSYWSSLITIISSGSLLSDETLKQTNRDVMRLVMPSWLVRE